MYIAYRDHLGYVTEEVDKYGISFCDGIAYVNDKKIPIGDLISIMETKED